MAKLNQVIAIEKGVKSDNYSALSRINKAAQKADLFNGFAKTYIKINEESEDLPPDTKRVQLTAQTVIKEAVDVLAELWTVEARREWSNTVAYADIIVDGNPLVHSVPVTYLLFLEKQLNDVKTLVSNIPILDTNDDWRADPNSELYKTEPVLTHRTKKTNRPLVLYDATPEHPAQTQIVQEDVLVGHWQTVKHSGAMTVPEKAQAMRRINALIRAVKEAREQANSIEEMVIPPVTQSLMNYLFPGTLEA